MTGVFAIDTYLLHNEYTDTRTGVKKSFKSMIGVAVSTKDYDNFKKGYTAAIEATLKACGEKKTKEVYCNYDFNVLYGKTGIPVHQIFFKEISPYIESINIFYSLFKKSASMNAWGQLEKELKHKLSKPQLSFDEIINRLNNSFPLFCVWKASAFIKDNNLTVISDHFQAKKCDAWVEIEDINLVVLHSGDRCNALIATADIIIQLIELRRRKAKRLYQYGTFREILPEMKNRVYEMSIHGGHFKQISPLSGQNIELTDKLKHPIFFILKDKNSFLDADSLKNELSLAPIFNLAFEKDGSVKFFNKSEDLKKIKDEDYMLYFSDEGKKAIDFIKQTLKRKIIMLDFKALSL